MMTKYNPQIDTNKTKWWYNSKGELHRLDGPAVEGEDGTKEWYQNGQLHREYGPAVEWSSGDKEWWINGKRFTPSLTK